MNTLMLNYYNRFYAFDHVSYSCRHFSFHTAAQVVSPLQKKGEEEKTTNFKTHNQ